MDRFIVLVFAGALAVIVDCEPLICDGCTSYDNAEQWAVEQFSEGREVYNVVHLPTAKACEQYIARFGYAVIA